MTLIDPSGILPPSPHHLTLAEAAVHLRILDDVAIARSFLHPGTVIQLTLPLPESSLILRSAISAGHKLALRAVRAGQPVRRYGQVIGFATQDIQPGDLVHTHNLGVQNYERASQAGVDAIPVEIIPADQRWTFLGYPRSDGRAGTRNFIAVIASVNCSAHVCREIAHLFTPEILRSYPHVDGVIALTHSYGCATRIGSQDYRLLQRTLGGMARHPNVGAAIFVSLGCESNPPADLIQNAGLDASRLPVLVIQDVGGVQKTIRSGIAAVEALLPQVNAVQRTPQPLSNLMLALQCGGSDAWSGVTANPLLGHVSDEIVRQGGAVVLAETTEIYGAEHLLVRRAASPLIADHLLEKVRWWEQHALQHGASIDNNRSLGNAAGGLTTIYEKSLGAIAKAGSTPLTGVYDYAEPVATPGFAFMDSPGYDPVSVTGQVAGGCNLVLFTTGRGSAFGFKPAPSIKVSTTTQLYEHMMDDMDFNAGMILDGVPIETASGQFLDLVLAVASGKPSKSEAQGIGEAEFAPWHLGSLL
jgi:altronate dehydratase